jgi:hypothetical protein
LNRARKPSHHSCGGTGARSVERVAASRPTQANIFTSRKVKPSAKKPFTRAIGYNIDVGFCFEKCRKLKEGIVL